MSHKMIQLQRNVDRRRSKRANLAELTRWCLSILALAGSRAMAVGEQPKIPGIMLPELTKVTPEMCEK